MLYDNEADERVSQVARALDRETVNRSLAAFPHIAALLTANGHSPDKAAEIIRVAQRSWSKNHNYPDEQPSPLRMR
jgi:hypothetical protein